MRKIGLLFLSIIVVLGSLGIGYSMWYQNINVTGSVQTDSLNAVWTTVTNADPPPAYNEVTNGYTGTIFPINPNYGTYDPNLILADLPSVVFSTPTVPKNVASTTVIGVGTSVVTITVNNAYPLYGQDMEVEFTYYGSIPVRVQSIQLVPVGDWTIDTTTPWAPNGTSPLWISLPDGIGTQLENGGTVTGSLKFVVQECAQQNASYTFQVIVSLVQWNEWTGGGAPPTGI